MQCVYNVHKYIYVQCICFIKNLQGLLHIFIGYPQNIPYVCCQLCFAVYM